MKPGVYEPRHPRRSIGPIMMNYIRGIIMAFMGVGLGFMGLVVAIIIGPRSYVELVSWFVDTYGKDIK